MDTRRPLGKYKRPLPPKHTPVSSDAETQIALERYLAVSGWLGLLLLLLLLLVLVLVLVVVSALVLVFLGLPDSCLPGNSGGSVRGRGV
jgi:hypothetical protein